MTLNDWLFAGVCGAAIYARSVSAMLFCAAYAIHSVLSPGMEQWQRYVVLILIDSAAAFIVCSIDPFSAYISLARDSVTKSFGQRITAWLCAKVTIIESINGPSSASVITGVFSGVFLVVNAAGFISWYLYFPPATYDAICSVVYVAMMAAFIDEGSNGRLRLAAYRLASSDTCVTVRKSLGMRFKGGKKI